MAYKRRGCADEGPVMATRSAARSSSVDQPKNCRSTIDDGSKWAKPACGRPLEGRVRPRARGKPLRCRASPDQFLEGRPAELAEQSLGLLRRDLLVDLMFGVTGRPALREIAARARDATAAFLRIHS